MGKANRVEVLYCFKCRNYTIVVKRDFPGSKVVECPACPPRDRYKGTIKSIRDAMRAKGKKPQSEEDMRQRVAARAKKKAPPAS